MRLSHLAWIPAAGAVGFFAAYLFDGVLALPIDLYYALYFASVLALFAVYARATGLDVRGWAARRIGRGAIFGLVVGAVAVQGVLARPATPPLQGTALGWDLLWRGAIYGAVDGLLLFALPWTIAWRAFDAERAPLGRKVAASAVAIAGTLLMTTAYHLGYRDFRSAKIVQPNIGSLIVSTATLASGNPAASVIGHAMLHVAAVLHSPETDLFLPPHREHGGTER